MHISGSRGGELRKQKTNTEPVAERKPIRLMSSTHLHDVERSFLCGCPDCLKSAGLEMITVFDPNTHKWRTMLVNWFSRSDVSEGATEESENL